MGGGVCGGLLKRVVPQKRFEGKGFTDASAPFHLNTLNSQRYLEEKSLHVLQNIFLLLFTKS